MNRDDDIEMKILAFDGFIYEAKNDFSQEMKESLSWHINKWKDMLRLTGKVSKEKDIVLFVYPSGCTYGLADFKKGESRILSASKHSILKEFLGLESERLSQEEFDKMKKRLKEIKDENK